MNDRDTIKTFNSVEKHFLTKMKYGERDWLNKNKDEIPQSYPDYLQKQIKAKSNHPRIKKVLLIQMWTDPSYCQHPFYQRLVQELKNHVQIFFPGVICEDYKNPPVELNLQYLQVNKLIRTRVRKDTGRMQICTKDLF